MKENCTNCGYVEREITKYGKRFFCSNCESERCFGWVTDGDVCSEWIRYTQYTKYYNKKEYGIEGCEL